MSIFSCCFPKHSQKLLNGEPSDEPIITALKRSNEAAKGVLYQVPPTPKNHSLEWFPPTPNLKPMKPKYKLRISWNILSHPQPKIYKHEIVIWSVFGEEEPRRYLTNCLPSGLDD